MATQCPTIAPLRGSSAVYERITNLIIAELERGVVPWCKSWTTTGLPKNLISGKEYRGINRLLLGLAPCFDSPFFLTFLQAKELGGHVKKGEHGFPVIKYGRFAKEIENERTGEAEIKNGQFLKCYTVFNADQCELPEGALPELAKAQTFEFTPIERAQQIAEDMPLKPQVRHGGNAACYSPRNDTVDMPNPNRFEQPANYYATLFHELTHSTGHASRLNRKSISDTPIAFASKTYSFEELIAELGASFLCAGAGIENTIGQAASYIENWLKRLKDDRSLIVKAASQAQQAADFILNAGGREQ